jgi:hypothetical protein
MDPPIDYKMFEWHAQQVQLVGGIFMITLQPIDIDKITDDMIIFLSEFCLKINSKYGVPIFMRYAHEMNGNWPNYGYRPTSFINSFRKVSRLIKGKTNMTSLFELTRFSLVSEYSDYISVWTKQGREYTVAD